MIFLGTVVMKVIVTDADEEGTLNTKISYGIVGSSSGMFYINAQSGVVMVRQSTLDREVRLFADLKFFGHHVSTLIVIVGKNF